MPGTPDTLSVWLAGGMLTTWMRLKYPHILDGAIAGSAPIWSYLGEVRPTRSTEHQSLHAQACLQGTEASVSVSEPCMILPAHQGKVHKHKLPWHSADRVKSRQRLKAKLLHSA